MKAPLLVVLLSAFSCFAAERERPLMRDFIGLNGHTVQFKPGLYEPVARLVRDYHPVSWDLGTNTAELPQWPFAKNRVDWNRVYGSWREKNFIIDVSLMFESIKRTNWVDVERDARRYGEAFAREFGPSGKRKLVEAVEIGNEPGDWNDADYTRMFQALAGGLRAGDAKLKIATCNITTGKSGQYEKSVTCIANSPELFDVLNVHSYAQLENWPTWRRSFPEDERLAKYLPDIDALCRWRDTNAPGKEIWLTEFGYDSSTKPAEKTGTFAKWVGVTDEQQAQWLVRSLLVFSAMPIDRAYIYFFNDDDKPSLHASAGITRKFQPKPSFHALAHLQRALGEYRFSRVVKNSVGTIRVHEYQHATVAAKRVWVAWKPAGDNKPTTQTLTGLPGRVVRAEQMPLTESTVPAKFDQPAADAVSVSLTGSPVFLFLEQ